jgi:hypothetical protein
VTDWLDRAFVPTKKLDLSTVTASLLALENAFAAIAAARADVDTNWGTEPSAPRKAQMDNLTAKAKTALAEAQRQIRDQFDSLRQDADQMRADARRQFATGSDGRHYRESLAGFAPLAQSMTPAMLAQMIQDANAAGLVAESRAWSQLARMRFPGDQGVDDSGTSPRFPTLALRQALEAADDSARTPYERQADDAGSAVDAAARRYRLFADTIGNRLGAVLDGSDKTPYDGNFSPANILGSGGERGE